MAKFVIFRDRAGQYRWNLVAVNGEIVASSEGYAFKSSAMATAKRIKQIASIAIIEDRTI